MPPVRILHVGVGIRGRHWLDFVKEHPDTESVAVADSSPEALEAVRKQSGSELPVYSDLNEALSGSTADAALIAAPSAAHADLTCRALNSGLTVLVEKPLASTMSEARQVLATAEQTGNAVLVAENYRYWPSERTVRHLIAEGKIGRVHAATLTDRRHMPSHTEGPWLAELPYPQLQEIAVHHFDSLRGFFQCDATRISTRVWNPPWSDYKHGACTEATIEMDHGIHVQYLGTLTSPRFGFSLWIEGEEGDLWTNRKYVFWRPRGSRWFRPVRLLKTPPGDAAKYPKGGTTSLLNSLRDAVQAGKRAETDGRDNLGTLAMVEAGKRSDQEHREVALTEILEETSP